MLSLVLCSQIYKERKNLAYTLQDARGVVSKLELIMGVMMHVLFVFFYLIIFDVSPTMLINHRLRLALPCSQYIQNLGNEKLLFSHAWRLFGTHLQLQLHYCCASLYEITREFA